MKLTQIKQVMRTLPPKQLTRLDEWLHELIRRVEAPDTKNPVVGRRVLEERTLDNRAYRLETVRCGKEKCKCARGQMHGPYWYSYARVHGRLKSEYVGKKLPRKVERELRQGKGKERSQTALR